MQSPPWSSNTRLVVTLVAFLMGIALLVFAFPLFQALLISALLAILIDPVVGFVMRKLHFNRPLAVAIVYILILIIIASIPAMMGTLAVTQVQRLGTNLQTAIQDIDKWISQPVVLFGFDFSPRNLLQQFRSAAGSTLTSLTGNTLNFLSGITTNFLWILLVLVSLYYFLKDGPKIKPWLVELAPPDYQSDTDRLLDELGRVWGVFIRVQVLIFIILAILFLLGASLVVWLYQLGLIPFSTLGLMLTLILVYALVQQVDNLWLRPQMLGSQMRLHPGLVFVGLIGALMVGGVVAAIMVVPLLGSVEVLGRYVRLKMLGLPPWPEETPLEKD